MRIRFDAENGRSIIWEKHGAAGGAGQDSAGEIQVTPYARGKLPAQPMIRVKEGSGKVGRGRMGVSYSRKPLKTEGPADDRD
jgi:hypothetical protein